jgi:ATP-dependent Clp protease adaptor protein ClpS
MAGTDIQLDEKIKVVVSEPKRWKVILLNDDSTPMDFVISMLMEVFKHSVDTAKEVMLEVHETGSGIAGIYIKHVQMATRFKLNWKKNELTRNYQGSAPRGRNYNLR